MSTTVKLKRGSGSDPSASDMVVGEPVIRTDTAELFFKKDDGSVAKVSGGGGGPDFKYLALRNAANDGSASYPGNDFTLVTSGTTTAVSPAAANTLLVSYGGVIQRPNSGTSTSGITGFIVDGSRFKTATNLAAAPDFILYQESGGIGEPSDNTVTTAKIVDDAVTADKLANSINSAIAANTAKVTNATHSGEVTGATALTIADNVVDEANLKVSNSPTNGYFLSAQSGNTGGLTWAGVDLSAYLPLAGGTMTGTLNISSSNKLRLGDSAEIQINHLGGNSFIEHTLSTGNLFIQADSLRLTNTNRDETFIACNYDWNVEIYYDNSKKLETTSSGVQIDGSAFNVLKSHNSHTIATIQNNWGSNATAQLKLISPTDEFNLIKYASGPAHIELSNSSDIKVYIGGSEKLRLDSNGDLGLGTTAVPQDSGARTLHIHDSTATERAHIRLTTGTSGTAADNGGFIGVDNNPDFYIYNQENGNLRFGTNGSERFRISNSGIIGVNIQSPIVGYGGDTGIHIHSSATSGTRGPTIHLTSGVSGTSASDGSKIHQSDTDLVIQNHENGGLFLGSGNAHRLTITSGGRCGIGTTSPSAQIHSYTSGSDGLLIQTSSYTSYVWQIESSGNLFNGSLAGELGIRGHSGIGFSANGGSSAQFRIESDGDLLGADTSIGSISDSRVKKNVVDYTYDLAKFKQLTPKTFDWINPDEHLKDTNVRGFLAQDVKTIDDYWIKETDSVNQLDKELIGEGKALSSKLGSTDAMYVSVIKQLIAKIETLETKVAALESA